MGTPRTVKHLFPGALARRGAAGRIEREAMPTTNQNSELFPQPLVDSLGRVHTSLRLSVTDRCNIRCFYCMPSEGVRFLPREEILTFEEMERFVRVAAAMGITRVRITGGEPLVRAELPELVSRLTSIAGVHDVAMTTNAMLLADHAVALKQAGLNRLNISLDTLDSAKFERITRRQGLDQVLAGIAAATQSGFKKIRLNAIAIRGETESEIIPLLEFALEHGLELRFIEYMPLDAEGTWQADQVLSGQRIREIIEQHFGPLKLADRDDPSQPAVDYAIANQSSASREGRVGFINPVSEPFCSSCDRLRLTAEGKIRNCLFSKVESDARSLIRGGGTDDVLAELIRACVFAKKPGHGMDDATFIRPEKAMYQIGG